MTETPPPVAFDDEHAERYDTQFEGLRAFKDGLHLAMDVAFERAPPEARALVVGAGTGQELLALAEQRPGWRFLALDPSAPMLEVCRNKVAAAGLEDRVDLHVGDLSTLDAEATFDVATSILVSQFLLDRDARTDFFQQIARHLVPGGHLVSADLSIPSPAEDKAPLLDFWGRALGRAGMPPERAEAFLETYDQLVAVAPPEEVAAIMQAGGFARPTGIYQAGMIRAWEARRAPTS